MKFGRIVLVCGLVVALAGCGKSLDGIYKDNLGLQKYEFLSDGTVYVSTMGVIQEGTYALDDNKVKITIEGETTIFDLNPDGSIQGALGMTLREEAGQK